MKCLLLLVSCLLPLLITCNNEVVTPAEHAAPVATTVPTPVQVNPPPYKVGYVGCWSLNINCNMIEPEEIDASAYTNLIFAFVEVNAQFQIDFMRMEDGDYLRRLVAHVNRNYPAVKVSVSLGGYSFKDNPMSMKNFLPMVSSPENRAVFVSSVVALMEEYQLSGIDFDWEDPKFKTDEQRKAGAEKVAAVASTLTVLKDAPVNLKDATLKLLSKYKSSWADFDLDEIGDDDEIGDIYEIGYITNFKHLLQEMRAAFLTKYQISVVFPDGDSYWFTSVNLMTIASTVDFMTLLALEYRGLWLKSEDKPGLVNRNNQPESILLMTRIGFCAELLGYFGIAKNKIVIALPFYWHTYRPQIGNIQGFPLETYGNTITSRPYSLINDQVEYAGDYTRHNRIAYYNNVNGESKWVTFQTSESYFFHVRAAKENGFGGVAGMFIDMDNESYSLSLAIYSGYVCPS